MGRQTFRRKLRLGELLVEYGLITKQQLEEALEKQRESGVKLGEVLINSGFVTRQNINEILEFQLGIPFINIFDTLIEPDAIKLVSESLVRRHQLLPVKIVNNELYVAMVDPLNIFAIDDIRIYSGKEVIPMLSTEEQIMKAIDIHYSKAQAMKMAEQFKEEAAIDLSKEITESDVDDVVKSAPIVKLVNTILEQAVRYGASDIHIEPFETFIKVRYRVDGNLQQVFEYELSLLPAVIARIKIMSNLDISERRKPQDGRITIKVDSKEYDIRVSILPCVFGEKVVMRINSKEGFTKGKAELGFFPEDLEKFENIISNPYGIILVTGPTGSGKSTTLYTALNELNREDINIVTVEDPVESQITGINQVQVNVKAGLTFAGALRSILRQDPDIIMIGEIRDAETADIAVKASVTGHLVVSTLHTNDSASSITRLIDMGIEPFLIGASVVGVIAQRLVRRLCPKCKEAFEAGEYEKHELGIPQSQKAVIYKAKGCRSCNESGYKGRVGVYEIMTVTKELRTAINHNANADELRDLAVKGGLMTLRANACRLVEEGTTTVQEMIRIAYSND